MLKIFKEGICPKCHEKIQVPDDRDEIICMYCGQKIRRDLALGIEKETDTAACEEKRAQALKGLSELIHQCDKPFQAFKKDRYPGMVEYYERTYKETFQAMEYLYQNSQSPEEWLQQMAEHFVEVSKEDISKYRTKGQKNRRQLDLNFLISIYLIPAMLKQKGEVFDPFADQLLMTWNEAYGTTLGKAHYEDIVKGFRRKLCYITTAVCESLGKDQDCYELKLLKEYRDQYLNVTPEGHALIEEYYDIAPTIVKRMDKQADRDRVYRELYEKYLRDCVEDIERGEYERCGRKYQEMVVELKGRYMLHDD